MDYINENRICQNCKTPFTIEADDFDFYKKINVPPPTFCRECRIQRRFAYRNERTLHRRKCAMTGKDIISCFSPDAPFTIIDRDLWWSDSWNPTDYAREYDFEKPFFIQFRQLMEKVPLPALFIGKCTQTKYGNHVGEFKNAYLVSASWIGENVMYASRANSMRDSLDVFSAFDSEFCYDIVACQKCSRVFYSDYAVNCVNSFFLYDCKNCTDCFGCTNLRNKSHHIFNEPYSKEEYDKKLSEILGGSYQNLVTAKTKFEILKRSAIHRFANLVNCQNVTGDNLANLANSKYCFDAAGDIRDTKFIINSVGPFQDAYDGYGVGDNANLLYEGIDFGVNGSSQFFVATVWDSMNAEYSYNCHGCNNIFGCVGLRKKEYCILNKQYSKEEYLALIPQIKKQMLDVPYLDKKGRKYCYGEYFPIEFSPFGYNETIANDYFPLSKDQILEEGYVYRDPEQNLYAVTKNQSNIPDMILDIDETILKDIIECSNCNKAYKIMPDELTFLKRFNLPLPRRCFECRHHDRLTRVNFPHLYHRGCMCDKAGHFHGSEKCPNEFETSYAPDRSETIYCEKCYQQEVI